MKKRILGLIALIVPLLCTGELLAAPFYEGKVISLIVWTEPGGGMDRNGRLVAKHLSKHIPGKPAIIVQNMPGANGIIATNHMYNLAKPDGLTFAQTNRVLPFSQLLKAKSVKFDMRDFFWIGSTVVEPVVFAIRSDLPYKSFADLRQAKEPIYVGIIGPSEPTSQFCMILKAFTGVNFKMVTYSGGAAINLALERKEVDGRGASYSSITPLIERGFLRLLATGRSSLSGVANLPVDEDLTTDKVGKAIMAMHSYTGRLGRPYILPPKTPDNLVNILREAFAKMVKDPAFIKDSEKNLMPVNYVTPDESKAVTEFIFNQPEEIIKEFSKYVKI